MLFGAFLAFETRKVTVPALNDSKFIGPYSRIGACSYDKTLQILSYVASVYTLL